ncbi:hypothetical protein CMO90_04115 [Candidatus Woesearchaeota archaeon]|jgi:NTP pyrophosphatase (non-canonical NTP hydrolase)|nr:hypothetical protein [Candidatus Woesearchaeota archaeon]|tara:strand:- start:1131 stop:1517 length:387 start_codon:yes stop_codon:yes gene_type:complete
MKEKFQELYETLKIDRNKSAWSKKNDFKQRIEELSSEIEEIKQAIEKNDTENLREELGDALWDLLFLIIIAEEKKLFTGKEVISETIEKLKRRKPWIFNGEKVSVEEEIKRWNKTKILEKQNKVQRIK